MVESLQAFERFVCGCCGRTRPASQLADFHLQCAAGGTEPLCRQCEDFLAQGLDALRLQIQNAGKTITPGAAAQSGLSHSGPTRPPSSRSIAPLEIAPPKRAASSTETEVLRLKYLALERFIEGFVRGLEASGLDRKRLSSDLNTGINALLKLKQTFVDERLRATVEDDRPSRSQVRRLLRHMDESALMVEEYVRYVSEGLSPPKTGREPSRPCRTMI